MRRDRPATWVVLGARRAILLADVIFATALQRSAELGRHEVATLARGISMLAVGAFGEPLRLRDIEAGDTGALYERTIRLKTGSLFCAAAELGAIAAGSKPGLRRAAAEFGQRIGEAYQIADDRSDVVVPAGTLTAEQTATLANLLAYFDGARKPPRGAKPGATTAPNRIGFDAMRVVAAMETEIDRRLGLACNALALFPPGPRLALLHRIPRVIVYPVMAAASPREPMGSPWSPHPCAETPTR
jgi:geranylgeranyl pyrophosphate synthase